MRMRLGCICVGFRCCRKLPRDLRHCAATNLRLAGVDTVTAMKIVGHKSEKLHKRYNSVSEADLRLAAKKLSSYHSLTL